MSSKIKIFAQIKYTMDEKHPNIKSVPKWYPGKIFTFSDTYTINPDHFYGMDHIKSYIRDDLKAIAGGGYNSDHIHNVEFTFKMIQ